MCLLCSVVHQRPRPSCLLPPQVLFNAIISVEIGLGRKAHGLVSIPNWPISRQHSMVTITWHVNDVQKNSIIAPVAGQTAQAGDIYVHSSSLQPSPGSYSQSAKSASNFLQDSCC